MAIRCWQLVAGAVCSSICLNAQTTVLYETKFEPTEGYKLDQDLAGQRGWQMDGSGGNGLIDNLFEGMGLQAYVGFQPPRDSNTVTSVWRPVDFNPAPANNPMVRFTVKFTIVRSKVGSQDDFRWSIYNTNSVRLF